MTKEEIKATILNLKLPEELEKIIFDMVDNAQEVNSGLLNAIADILDNQADFDGAMADAYEDTQKVDEMTIKELEVLDAGQYAQELQTESQIQDDLIKELENPTDQQAAADTPAAADELPVPAQPVEPTQVSEPASEIPSEPQPSYEPSSPDVAQITESAPGQTGPSLPPVMPPEDEQVRQESIAELKDQIAQMGESPQPENTNPAPESPPTLPETTIPSPETPTAA